MEKNNKIVNFIITEEYKCECGRVGLSMCLCPVLEKESETTSRTCLFCGELSSDYEVFNNFATTSGEVVICSKCCYYSRSWN